MTSNLTAGTRIGYILMGIISCVAGVWMFLYPGLNTPTLGMVLGAMFVGYGIVEIISYFSSGAFRSICRYSLIMGIVLIVLGIVMFTNLVGTMNFLGILLGVVLLIGAGLRIWFSFEAKAIGVSSWWAILILGILQLVVACMFLFNPSQSGELLTVYVGALFLSQGLMDLSIGIFAA